MSNSTDTSDRRPRRRLSIAAGNLIQLTGLVLGCVLLWSSTAPAASFVRTVAMLAGFLLIYFSTHSSAHYLVGRLLGITFTHYSLGGSSHAAAYPPGIRYIFERLPFFAAHSDPQSLRAASPPVRASMFAAGITATVILGTAAAGFAYRAGVPGSFVLLVGDIAWQIGSLIAETRPGGDLARAAQALRRGKP